MNASIETRKEELKNRADSLSKSFEKDITSLMAVCPEWKVIDTNSISLRAIVTLVFTSNKHRKIDIVFCAAYEDWQNEKFFTNIGGTGEIDMLDAKGNASYYIAVGSLLSKTEMLSRLKGLMKDYTESMSVLREEYQRLAKED